MKFSLSTRLYLQHTKTVSLVKYSAQRDRQTRQQTRAHQRSLLEFCPCVAFDCLLLLASAACCAQYTPIKAEYLLLQHNKQAKLVTVYNNFIRKQSLRRCKYHGVSHTRCWLQLGCAGREHRVTPHLQPRYAGRWHSPPSSRKLLLCASFTPYGSSSKQRRSWLSVWLGTSLKTP